jgi:molecular chaperone DnaK
VYQTRKLLKDQGDKISGPEKEAVDTALSGLEEALKGNDLGAIKDGTERLMNASQTFSQQLYERAAAEQAAASGGGPGAGATGGASDDDVVDAEIVDDDQR